MRVPTNKLFIVRLTTVLLNGGWVPKASFHYCQPAPNGRPVPYIHIPKKKCILRLMKVLKVAVSTVSQVAILLRKYTHGAAFATFLLRYSYYKQATTHKNQLSLLFNCSSVIVFYFSGMKLKFMLTGF